MDHETPACRGIVGALEPAIGGAGDSNTCGRRRAAKNCNVLVEFPHDRTCLAAGKSRETITPEQKEEQEAKKITKAQDVFADFVLDLRLL